LKAELDIVSRIEKLNEENEDNIFPKFDEVEEELK